MKIFAALAVFAFGMVAGCMPAPPSCPAGYEDLSVWQRNAPDPKSNIIIDPACPVRADIAIGSSEAVYVEKSLLAAAGKSLTLSAEVSTDCLIGDGILSLGFTEDGAGASSQIAPLGSQNIKVLWTATRDEVGMVFGAQANHPCKLTVMLSTHP